MMIFVSIILCILLCVQSVTADVNGDGVDDYIEGTVTFADITNDTTLTVTMYLKSTGSDRGGDDCGDFMNANMGEPSYLFLTGRGGTTGEFICFIFWNGASFTELPGTMTPGWHHVAYRLTGGTAAVFVDGVSVASVGTAGLNGVSTGLVRLLNATGGSEGGDDRITDVKAYDVGLSDAEINRGRGKVRMFDRTKPNAYWPLVECANGAAGNGVSFKDISGNVRHITGNDGANNTGLLCSASEYVSYPMEIQ